MNWRVFIPNLFTCLNLFFGCIGIYLACNENILYASGCIAIAAVFDFFDGLLARWLNGGSELGKQLDSLADCVTFGVLPGIIMFQLITINYGEYNVPVFERPLTHVLISLSGFIISVFSALRLAKFNLDTRQSESFLGVPTPANAILIASFPPIIALQYNLNLYSSEYFNTLNYFLTIPDFYSPLDMLVIRLICSPKFMATLSILLSLLLVVEIPLFSLKFKKWKWRRNKTRYIFIFSSLFILVTMNFTKLYFLSVPFIIALYIGLSIAYYLIKGRV